MAVPLLPIKRSAADLEEEEEAEERRRMKAMKAHFAHLACQKLRPKVQAEWQAYMKSYHSQIVEALCPRCAEGWLPRCSACKWLERQFDKQKNEKRRDIQKRAKAEEKEIAERNFDTWLACRQRSVAQRH